MSENPEVLVAVLGFITAVVGLLAALVSRKKVVEVRHHHEHIGVKGGSGHSTAPSLARRGWFYKNHWLLLSLIFFPVTIYGLLRRVGLSRTWTFALMFVALMLIGALNDQGGGG